MAAKQNGGWYWNPSTKSASQYWSSGSGPSGGGGHSGGGGGGGASGGGSPAHSYVPPPPPPPTPRDFLNPRKQNASDAVSSLFNMGSSSNTAGQSGQLRSQQPGPLLGPPAPKTPTSSPTSVATKKNSYVDGTPEWAKAAVDRASSQYGIPSKTLTALLKKESSFNPNAKNPSGAVGIAQFMPGTAKGLGIDPMNPDQAIEGAAKYLSGLKSKFGGKMDYALAAYNAGEGNVHKYNGIPPFKETQKYVKDIMDMSGDGAGDPPAEAMPTSGTPQVNANVSHATAQAVQNGADPKALDNARKSLGAKDFIGLCERFVEQTTKGRVGIFKSAIDAWNKQQDKAVPGIQGIKPGDAVYFTPNGSNGGYGHAGVYAENNQFISATDNGVQQFDLGKWIQMTGQQILGYIPGTGGGSSPQGQVASAPPSVQTPQRPPIGPQMLPQNPNIAGMSLPQILQQYGSRLSPDILKKVQGAIAAQQGQGQPPASQPAPPPQVAMMGGQQAPPGNSLATEAIRKRMRRQQGMAA